MENYDRNAEPMYAVYTRTRLFGQNRHRHKCDVRSEIFSIHETKADAIMQLRELIELKIDSHVQLIMRPRITL